MGLGNVWRFPYLAQKNGGGAFLVPYFTMLAIQGIPIFYLELAVGQRLRKGAIAAWHEVNSIAGPSITAPRTHFSLSLSHCRRQISPYLGGIGISSAVVSYVVALYYNTIIAWCLIYLLHSFESPLPWAECPKRLYSNFTYDIEPECVASSPTQYYWYRSTLMSSPSVNEPIEFNYHVALALLTAWFLVYICMIQGITSSGKIVYITAIFPYVVLIIFFFRGITLPGASKGIAHLFTPRWELLLDPVVWLEAGTQIFFSLGLAFGGLIAFSSYNPANNNCYRDALVVAFTNCGTSMFAGVVVFSVIGFKATSTYEKCLSDRNVSILANATNLPVCDLQRELDNVMPPIPSSRQLATVIHSNPFVAERFRHRSGVHHIHRGDQSVPRSPILGSFVLFDAVYARHRFPIRHARRPRHLIGRHEIVPELAEGHDYRGN